MAAQVGNRLIRLLWLPLFAAGLLLLPGVWQGWRLDSADAGEEAVKKVVSADQEPADPEPAMAAAVVAVTKESTSVAEGQGREKGETDEREEEDEEDDALLDPMGANAACYICHMTFVHESISKIHLKEQVDCIECHGLSAAHANDEDIGATKPDKIYHRKRVDAMCTLCHEGHDVPADDVVARFILRKLPLKRRPICTDCHGTHRIDQAEVEDEFEEPIEDEVDVPVED
jgi:Cytochrome c3